MPNEDADFERADDHEPDADDDRQGVVCMAAV